MRKRSYYVFWYWLVIGLILTRVTFDYLFRHCGMQVFSKTSHKIEKIIPKPASISLLTLRWCWWKWRYGFSFFRLTAIFVVCSQMQLLLKSWERQNKSGAYIPKFLLKGLGKAVLMDWLDWVRQPNFCCCCGLHTEIQQIWEQIEKFRYPATGLDTPKQNQSAAEEFNTLHMMFSILIVFKFKSSQIQHEVESAQ